MAIFLVWNVSMPRKAKIKVLIAFAVRLFVLPPTFARLRDIYIAINGNDYTYDRVDATVMSSITLHIGIILATIPCAKPFFSVIEAGIYRSPLDANVRSPHSNSRVSIHHSS